MNATTRKDANKGVGVLGTNGISHVVDRFNTLRREMPTLFSHLDGGQDTTHVAKERAKGEGKRV